MEPFVNGVNTLFCVRIDPIDLVTEAKILGIKSFNNLILNIILPYSVDRASRVLIAKLLPKYCMEINEMVRLTSTSTG